MAHGVGWLSLGGGLFMLGLPVYIGSGIKMLWRESVKHKSCGNDPSMKQPGDEQQSKNQTDTKTDDDITDAIKYGISFNGQKYIYGDYSYDSLADAVAYAKKATGKEGIK